MNFDTMKTQNLRAKALIFNSALLLGFLFSQPASATYIGTVIAGIQMDENNGMKMFIRPSGTITLAGCQGNSQWPFVIDVSTEMGKRLQGMVMLAYASKANVVLRGTDTCLVHTGVETIYRVELY